MDELKKFYAKLSKDIHQHPWNGPDVKKNLRGYGEKYNCLVNAMVDLMGLEISKEDDIK